MIAQCVHSSFHTRACGVGSVGDGYSDGSAGNKTRTALFVFKLKRVTSHQPPPIQFGRRASSMHSSNSEIIPMIIIIKKELVIEGGWCAPVEVTAALQLITQLQQFIYLFTVIDRLAVG